MSWDTVLFDAPLAAAGLLSAIDSLLASQRKDWIAFRDGEASLSAMRTKRLAYHGAEVLVQANPGRTRSTHARTDAQSVAARKCYLCPENMPAEERGIGFGPLVILPNPYPVLSRHCTIPARRHRPQQLEGHVRSMLELARQLGPSMLVFYNGPRCGASAPDHFHFQACDAAGIPLLEQLRFTSAKPGSVVFESFGRRMFVLADYKAECVQQAVERTLHVMRQVTAAAEEPMVNLLALFREELYLCVLFPRAAHRPACYFDQGAGRLAVSPAALEMAGVLVVAEPAHFDRVDARAVHRIYSEVSLDPMIFSKIAQEIS